MEQKKYTRLIPCVSIGYKEILAGWIFIFLPYSSIFILSYLISATTLSVKYIYSRKCFIARWTQNDTKHLLK